MNVPLAIPVPIRYITRLRNGLGGTSDRSSARAERDVTGDDAKNWRHSSWLTHMEKVKVTHGETRLA